MLSSDERSTVLMFRQLHNTARVMRNEVSVQVEEIEKKKGQDLDFSDVAPLVMGTRGREAEAKGDAEGGIWTAGQVVGLINDSPSCQELMDRIMKEAEDTMVNRLQRMIVPSKLWV